ncbi:sulfatase [Planctomycetota bacterium]
MNCRAFIISVAVTAASGMADQGKDRLLKQRPNILLIMTDQQYAEAMSCAENSWLKTPAMDRIAQRGIRFEKCYTSNPICVPSRTSMFTGLMGHHTGIDQNEHAGKPMRGGCIAKALKQAGYDTGYTGKWHIPRDIKDKKWSGFDYQVGVDAYDPQITRPAIDFIKTKRSKPFFLVASYRNPHDICQQARMMSGIEDTYPNGDIPALPDLSLCPPLPENIEPPDIESEAIRVHQTYETMYRVYPTHKWADDSKWRQFRWAYYRMCEIVDGHIGKILDVLEETRQLNNTVVLFTSDHGDGLGAHRWNQKTLFYEETARIPFIVSHPGTLPQGQVDSEILINTGIDIASTVYDIAGIPQHRDFTGQRLYSRLLGKDVPTHDFIVGQSHLHRAYGQRGDFNSRMLRTPKYKYVCFDGGKHPEMLFDMESDPGELTNLVYKKSATSILQQHRHLLKNWIKEQDDWFKMPSWK